MSAHHVPPSLVLEETDGAGLRLYLGGDLQFDTADEAIYHERLAHPAMSVALARFEAPLDLLVVGGGDGLLVRELLRHDAVRAVRVVDVDARVVAFARDRFAAFNQGALDDPRVRVTIADAREVLDELGHFHAVFSDLTFPGSLADCALFTRDWFARLQTRTRPGGVLAVNALSPEKTTGAFWCVHQTLRAAGWHPVPMHFDVPSFRDLGYGRWGAFLASDRPIERAEVFDRTWPDGLTTLDPVALRACFAFPRAWAVACGNAHPALDDGRTLFEAILDGPSSPFLDQDGATLDFLGRDDFGPIPLAIETGALPRLRDWLARRPGSGIDDLLAHVPLNHRVVTRELVRAWSEHLVPMLHALDLRRLVRALLKRAAALPSRLVEELRRFRALLARGLNPFDDPLTWGWRFFSVLMLVLVLSQTALPSAAYAKGGFFGGGYRGGSHYHSSGSSGHSQDPEALRRVLGGAMMLGGLGGAAFSLRKKSN